MSDYDWVACPECLSVNVNVSRNVADMGGTESLTISCLDCQHVETVIP